MKTTSIIFFLLLFLSSSLAFAVENTPPPLNSSDNPIFLSGEIIAAEISKATGCAISPILGISVLGAYTYYTTPIEERSSVPWHAKPFFWGPLAAVLLGIILKDSAKITLPKIIIMPLDAIETLLEKNASAMLGLLVVLSSVTGRGIEQLKLSGLEFDYSFIANANAGPVNESTTTALSTGAVELLLLSTLVTLVFGLVWMVSQAFNFLIFLCPFSWIDLSLAMFKNFIILLLVGAYAANPFLGLLVSSLIVILSVYLFARSFRFIIFGTIVSADILLKSSRTHVIESERIMVFTATTLENTPALTYGSLTADDSMLIFEYRPWLIMRTRTVATQYDCSQCEIITGTFFPVITTKGNNFNTDIPLFRLRPLYSSHEHRIAELFGFKGIQDKAFGKTLRDGYRWVREQLGFPVPNAQT